MRQSTDSSVLKENIRINTCAVALNILGCQTLWGQIHGVLFCILGFLGIHRTQAHGVCNIGIPNAIRISIYECCIDCVSYLAAFSENRLHELHKIQQKRQEAKCTHRSWMVDADRSFTISKTIRFVAFELHTTAFVPTNGTPFNSRRHILFFLHRRDRLRGSHSYSRCRYRGWGL